MLFKKRISSVPTLDLRNYTPKALSGIKSISSCAILLLPKNPSEEFMNQFSRIKLNAVAMTLNAEPEKTFKLFNGVSIVSRETVDDNSICLCNGVTFISKTEELKNVDFIFNGMLIKNKDAKFNSLSCNGGSVEWDFDESKIMLYTNKVEVDSSFLKNCKDGAIIAAGNKVVLDSGVKEEDIVSKDIRFVAGNKVVCDKSIYGCVASRSAVGNKVSCED